MNLIFLPFNHVKLKGSFKMENLCPWIFPLMKRSLVLFLSRWNVKFRKFPKRKLNKNQYEHKNIPLWSISMRIYSNKDLLPIDINWKHFLLLFVSLFWPLWGLVGNENKECKFERIFCVAISNLKVWVICRGIYSCKSYDNMTE